MNKQGNILNRQCVKMEGSNFIIQNDISAFDQRGRKHRNSSFVSFPTSHFESLQLFYRQFFQSQIQLLLNFTQKMSISANNTWKPFSNRILDPILALTNKSTSLSDSSHPHPDRFLSDPSQMKNLYHLKTQQNDQNQCINASFSNPSVKYEDVLLKACGVGGKKRNQQKKNKHQYQSKINRDGYLLNYEGICPSYQEQIRKIPAEPLKVISAPKLKDDFYTNLLDWGTNDYISVVLDNAAYVWSKRKNQTEKLIEGYISCVKWGKGLLLGEETGRLKIIDTETKTQVSKWRKHEGRIGTIDIHGNQNLVASGSKDKNILIWDLRNREIVSKLQGHRQEICGLKWSPDGNYLASGGNDNWVSLWNFRMNKMETKFTEHTAAVKALAWSPHQHSILATGGGSTDKTIKIWNTHENRCCETIQTGSQVCNMIYCKNTNELVSTHGFSLNSINIWNGKTMKKIGSLQGHTYRVLYLAKSADQDTIVTGSGDQTLRFWKIYSEKRKEKQNSQLEVRSNFLR